MVVIRGQKAAKQLFLTFVLFHQRERVGETRETRDERGIHTRTHTHREFLKRERETVCCCACVRVKREREREIDAFFFCVTDELIQRERKEFRIKKDDVAASFRVVLDDFGWFVQQ